MASNWSEAENKLSLAPLITLPILFSQGTGADVMKPIAAPLVGGMITAALLSLVLIPVVYSLWLGRELPER